MKTIILFVLFTISALAQAQQPVHMVADWQIVSDDPVCCCAQLFRDLGNATETFDIACDADGSCTDLVRSLVKGRTYRSTFDISYGHDSVSMGVKIHDTTDGTKYLDDFYYIHLSHTNGRFGIQGNCTGTGVQISSFVHK